MGKYASLIIGLGLLFGALMYVRLLGLRSEFEYVILRTVLALGGGYAAVGLLGMFELQSKLSEVCARVGAWC